MNNRVQFLQNNIELSEQKIYVFSVQLDALDYKEFIAYLSEEEQQRADRLKIEFKKKQFIITRGILRKLLSICIGKESKEIQFFYGEHKKPYIEDKFNNKSIEFNISHSADQALVAISLNNKVGVDIEKVNPEIDYQSLSKRFFSDKENEELASLDKKKQLDAFYRVWVRKESFIKATGKGIAYGLEQFSVSLDDIKQSRVETTSAEVKDEEWYCYDLMNIKNYKTALTSQKKDIDLIFFQ